MSRLEEVGQLGRTGAERAAEILKDVGPNNALRSLDPADAGLVWGLLKYFQDLEGDFGKEMLAHHERAAEIAADARELAERMKAEIFEGVMLGVLDPISGVLRRGEKQGGAVMAS